jgi:hypothetical protein
MHRFVRVLQQQLAANDLPPGSMIIAELPVPPAVYRQLRSHAEAAGQTPTQFMGSILTAAAGRTPGPALRRQTSKVGAGCGNAARPVLCGGCPVMDIPTAIRGGDRAASITPDARGIDRSSSSWTITCAYLPTCTTAPDPAALDYHSVPVRPRPTRPAEAVRIPPRCPRIA